MMCHLLKIRNDAGHATVVIAFESFDVTFFDIISEALTLPKK